ncbi:MAG TPA: hypothetical protein VK120_10460 [Sporosarcina sp.]|nr:hypothetical protein [Sporosarcina sp.]
MLLIFIIAILVIFVFDFAKLRKQNETVIEQNKQLLALLEEIKRKR